MKLIGKIVVFGVKIVLEVLPDNHAAAGGGGRAVSGVGAEVHLFVGGRRPVGLGVVRGADVAGLAEGGPGGEGGRVGVEIDVVDVGNDVTWK